VGGPLVPGKVRARGSRLVPRKDGGWIDGRIDPVTLATVDEKANHEDRTGAARGLWAPSEHWSITPSILLPGRRERHLHVLALYSIRARTASSVRIPRAPPSPDKFYLPSLKIEGDIGSARLISNTILLHRQNQTGYEGTPVQPRFLPGVRILPAHATD